MIGARSRFREQENLQTVAKEQDNRKDLYRACREVV